MSANTEISHSNSIFYILVNGMFFVQYFATNFAVSVIMGLTGVVPSADQNAWREDIVGPFLITLGASIAIMFVPAIIFGFANVISQKWKKRAANGWLWLEAPTFLIYSLIIVGYMQGWASKG